MKIIIVMALQILSAIVFYLLEKKTKFNTLANWKKQAVIGVSFGLITCAASDLGLYMDGALVNARDAGPLIAGLMFGSPAGIISGVIGALYRLFWGADIFHVFTTDWLTTMFSVDAAGGFTRIACTVGTLCAGLFGAWMRRFMFNNKRPSWVYGILVGITTETFHLFLIFIFRLNYLERVFDVIRACTVPMIVSNTMSLIIIIVIFQLLSGEKREKKKTRQDLAKAFQKWLFTCVILSFFATTFGMGIIENKLTIQQTQAALEKTMLDIKEKIELDDGIDNFVNNNFTWHVGQDGGIIIAKWISGSGSGKDLEIVLNGKEYNKGQIIPSDSFLSHKVWKAADNFFSAELPVNGENVPAFGMYMFLDEDHIIISYIPKAEAVLYQGVSLTLLIFSELLVFAALFIFIYYLIKKLVVDNLNKVNSTLEEITGGNLNAVVDVNSHSEFVFLSDEINRTVDTLKHYIDAAAARIDAELEFAKTIQLSVLPNVFPPFPNRKEFELYALMNTAKEVGGDFYDYYFVGEDKLAFLIADVSGKGIPAAMFMMQSKTIIKGYAEAGLDANEILTAANNKLCEANDAGMFVTVFLCIIDLKTGLVKYSNAGHNPPLIYRKNQGYEYFRARGGIVLAGMEGYSYKQGEIRLNPGDRIYLYTDGVTEAADINGELYGEDRLLKVLNKEELFKPEEICRTVKNAVDEFVGDAEQFDDITMVSICYKGRSTIEKIEVDAAIENIEVITDFINEQLEAVDCPIKEQTQIDIALDEIFSNIVHYGYINKTGKVTVKYELTQEPTAVNITFIDDGIKYDPLLKEDPDLTLSADEREIGGLGIYLVKKTMDDLVYEYKNNQNNLTLIKNI